MEVFCKYCGYENTDDALFCESCGADLSSYNLEDAPGGASRRNKFLLVVVAVILLVMGVAILITSENYIQSDTGPDATVSKVCPYCGSGINTMVVVRENTTHQKWYCQYCDNTWWERVP